MQRRKLLIASIGVATVTYLACSSENRPDVSSGNLVGPPEDTNVPEITIDTAAPGAPALVAPADGSTGQPLRPTFTWAANVLPYLH